MFDGWSQKVSCDEFPDPSRSKPAAMRQSSELEYAYRIKAIDMSEVADTVTYNLEVEDDESYLLAGMVSHNCKIPYDLCTVCGTMRKNAKDPDQCDHMRYEMGKMSEDGKIVGMVNVHPKFFDISFVSRPADRIAWNLKYASDGALDSVKLAELEGVVVPDSIGIASDSAMAKLELIKRFSDFESLYTKTASSGARTLSDRYYWELRKAASAVIPDDFINALRDIDPTIAMLKLARVGIVLSPEAFLKYALGSEYTKAVDVVPAYKDAVRGCYGRMLKVSRCQEVCNDSTFDVNSSDNCVVINTPVSFEKAASDLTFVGSGMEQRVIDGTISNNKCEISVDNNDEKVFNDGINKLAEKYAAYKLSAVRAVLSIHNTDRDALVAVATAQNMLR